MVARLCCSPETSDFPGAALGPLTPSPFRPGARREAGAAGAGTEEGGIGAASPRPPATAGSGRGGWAGLPPPHAHVADWESEAAGVTGPGCQCFQSRHVLAHTLTAYSPRQGTPAPPGPAPPQGAGETSGEDRKGRRTGAGPKALVRPRQRQPPLRAPPPGASDGTAGTRAKRGRPGRPRSPSPARQQSRARGRALDSEPTYGSLPTLASAP